ncbi:MAG: outer membrane protein transport protein [Sideroxydans sp.]
MKMNKIVVSLLAAGIMASPLAHATNGYFPMSYGTKNEGMGGVGFALPQDAIAAANNPAGMVMVGDRIDFGLIWFKPTRNAEITGNGAGLNGSYDGNGKSNFFIPSFGYNKMISADTALGVSVFGNGGMNTQYDKNPFASFGATGPAGINLEQLFVAPTWAMKLNPTNAVGVALNLAYQRFSATGLQPFDNAGFSSNPGFVTNNGTDTSTGYGLRVGWTGQVTTDVTLGATYQTKTKMGKFDKYKGLFADQGGFDIPSKYGVGVAFKATPETMVAFDVERINYADVPSVGNAFTSLPPAYGGTGPQLGASNGVGFGWQNMTALKLGVSHAYNSKLTVRAGLNHNDQQIPSSQTLLNILAPGVVQNHLSLGATWTLADKSELTVAYVHAFQQTVNGSASIPAAFGGGESNISMYQDSMAISYGW